MIIWIILFIVVLGVSFVLAFQSMTNYHGNPRHNTRSYTLFLIRKPEALTSDILAKIYNQARAGQLTISFEKLIKGPREALVVFGSASLLRPLTSVLDLLELEDYSKRIDPLKLAGTNYNIIAWEVGSKNEISAVSQISNLKDFIPTLNESEEFWWQLILKPTDNEKSTDVSFYTTIKGVLKADNPSRTQELKAQLSQIGSNVGLIPLPQVFTSPQLIKFYQERSGGKTPFSKASETGVNITLAAKQIQSLLGLVET